MLNQNEKQPTISPFHRGEQAVQKKYGVREKMEQFGSRVIRDRMPEQHRNFYQQLAFVFVGYADQQGNPWASILFNKPGFIETPDAKSLVINSHPVAGDPLNESLSDNNYLGLLGIELQTRRRNRLATHVTSSDQQGIHLTVDQAFGNCPQYIQKRSFEFIEADQLAMPSVQKITEFDQRAQQLIKGSDTFFVASVFNDGSQQASQGADVSHRGGKPGFIAVDNNKTLTIPDYMGNSHFNTLGNFVENPRAGLLFVDFESGHILTLTGTVEIVWQSEQSKHFVGAERFWKFHIKEGRWLNNSLPIRWKFNEYSTNSLMTGTWQEAQKLEQAALQKDQWLPYQVTKIVDESSVIKSFYLTPVGHYKANFKAGQFLTVKTDLGGQESNQASLIRTYTVSSAPNDELFRISVKHQKSAEAGQADGQFSSYLHQQLKIGDVIYGKAPQGSFNLDTSEKRPAVLLAAGVGITPMVAMARDVLQQGLRTRHLRPLTLIVSAQDQQQRAFFDELQGIEKQSQGGIRTIWCLTNADKSAQVGTDFHHSGRISKAVLQAILVLDDYDFYLCGPTAFMQAMYDLLSELGVKDKRIKAEAFGPASLQRKANKQQALTSSTKQNSAKKAIVHFTKSGVEQAWSEEDGNLLDFAEKHGFNPDFSCRNGHCGSCKTRLLAGDVVYANTVSADVKDNQVLLCSAVPAAVKGQDIVNIKIDL